MQKKLIALAVAGVLAAPLAAQADVEIYGQARMSADYSGNNDVAPMDKTAFSVSSNKSRIGFKGSEDLGNGLKGLWQIEQGVEFDTGQFGSIARDTFLGLGGNFGTVLAGKLSTPYRTATERLDVFKDTKADYNAIIGSVGRSASSPFPGQTSDTDIGNLRTSNSLAYVTPNMSGFQGTLAYVANYTDLIGGPGDNLPRGPKDTVGKASAYSLSGTYDNGPLFLALAYENLNKANTLLSGDGGSTKAMKLGGGWNFGQGTTIGALWEKLDLGNFGGEKRSRNAWYLSGQHKMGDISLKAAFGQAGKMKGLDGTGANHYSLGVGYDLSKATEVYALYTGLNNKSNGDYGLETISNAVVGKDINSVSIGINHKFSSK